MMGDNRKLIRKGCSRICGGRADIAADLQLRNAESKTGYIAFCKKVVYGGVLRGKFKQGDKGLFFRYRAVEEIAVGSQRQAHHFIKDVSLGAHSAAADSEGCIPLCPQDGLRKAEVSQAAGCLERRNRRGRPDVGGGQR